MRRKAARRAVNETEENAGFLVMLVSDARQVGICLLCLRAESSIDTE